MKKYFPILLAKAGELNALQRLSDNVKDETVPILEILSENLVDGEGKYKDDLQDRISEIWSFDDHELFVDFSLFEKIATHITKVKRFLSFLLKNDIDVVPVIQFNSDPSYVALVSSLISLYDCNICIRESNDTGGIIDFNDHVADMLKTIGTVAAKTSLLIDLGFVESTNDKMLAATAYTTIVSLPTPREWKEVIVASGSFLRDLGVLPGPATQNSQAKVYRLPRLEWTIWTTLRAKTLPTDVKYSDYGTKHPYYLPAAFEGSASIKYTKEKEFVIYRGKKASEHAKGGGQYNDSAKALISTSDYCGRGFSWGDNEIYEIGNRTDKPGNAENWVRISQNHHITFLHSLL